MSSKNSRTITQTDKPTPIPPEDFQSLLRFALEYRLHFFGSNEFEDEVVKRKNPFSFLVSSSWLERLNQYIGYPEIIDKKEAAMTSKKHPGTINEDILESEKVLVSSKVVPDDSEFSYLNAILKPGLAVGRDFLIIEKSAWSFLKRHFTDAIEIKRPNFKGAGGFLKTVIEFKTMNVAFVYYEMSQTRGSLDGWRIRNIQIMVPIEGKLRDLKAIILEKTRLLFGPKDSQKATKAAMDRLRLWKLPETFDSFCTSFLVRLQETELSRNDTIFFNGTKLNQDDEFPLVEMDVFWEDCVLLAENPKLEITRDKYIFKNQADEEEKSPKRVPVANEEKKQKWKRVEEKKYGRCSFCCTSLYLTHQCICESVFYCSIECFEGDSGFHGKRCEKETLEVSEKSKMGLTGLENMGNTCYMNSGIQCISNTKELTEYFLEKKHEAEINEENPIGTNGKMAKAFAYLLRNLWYGTSGHYRPYSFKSTLGRANPMFEGYEQHDSHEVICFILDKIHEDLNRIKKKPVVDPIEKEKDETDFQTARRSWIGFKRRNHSIIVDLMFGQLRSKLSCPRCNNANVTFDAFNFVTLPIPKEYKKEINISFVRKGFSQLVKYSTAFYHKNQMIWEFHDELEAKFGVPRKLMVCGVFSFSQKGKILSKGTPALQVYKMLKKEKDFKFYVFECTEAEIETLESLDCILVHTFIKMKKSKLSFGINPIVTFIRPFFFKKQTSALELFKAYIEHLDAPLKLKLLMDLQVNFTDEELIGNMKAKKPFKIILKRPETHFFLKYFSKETKIVKEEVSIEDKKWVLGDRLDLEKTNKASGQYFCDINVLFNRNSAFKLDRLSKWDSFYNENPSNKAPSQKFSLFDCFNLFQRPETLDEMNAWYCKECKDHVRAQKELRIFKVPEILIIQLKRFKEKSASFSGFYQKTYTKKITSKIEFPVDGLDLEQFVMSKGTIEEDYQITPEEIYKEEKEEIGVDAEAPKGLVEPIEKPKEAEEIPKSEENEAKSKSNLIYDLYAVSNHLGTMNQGHYTAFVKNQVDGHWYHFDDADVTMISPARVVSEAAYVLFYKRRKE